MFQMQKEASEMANEQLAEILAEVGGCVADIVGSDPEGAYLYAESDGGSYGAGVFQDVGESVTYFDPDDALFEQIVRLWAAAPANAKWAVLEFEIVEQKFDARFAFAEEIDPDETIDDRRERALRARYGDKPVVYPPMDDDFHELTEDDLSKD